MRSGVVYYSHREGITLKGKEVRKMYEVTTALKTIATKVATEAEALEIASEAFKTHNYVEVKAVKFGINGWFAKSVKVLYR